MKENTRYKESMIYRVLAEVQEQGVSHDPEIKKRTLLSKGELANLCMFSQSYFQPGQHCPAHRHESMAEVFFVESGSGTIWVEQQAIKLSAGVCVVVEPGELHELKNDGEETLILTYFGLECSTV